MCQFVSTPSGQQILDVNPKLDISRFDGELVEYYLVMGFSKDKPLVPAQLQSEPNILNPSIWTFVPYFIKDLQDLKYATQNARDDKIFEGRMYSKAILESRALLWVNGFYEYHYDTSKSTKAIPYYIYMPNKEPFTMGCVYNIWNDVPTLSIITVEGNKRMSEIHNKKPKGSKAKDDTPDPRMPLIIHPEERTTWLSSDLRQDDIKHMMQPYDDGILLDHSVSQDFKSLGNDLSSQAEVVY